ncbi:hypothetical protein GKODMF_12520 [Candidatus Electrothrix gigas]
MQRYKDVVCRTINCINCASLLGREGGELLLIEIVIVQPVSSEMEKER